MVPLNDEILRERKLIHDDDLGIAQMLSLLGLKIDDLTWVKESSSFEKFKKFE